MIIHPKARLLLPLVAALALSACMAPFEARVARFQLLPPPSGTSFVVEPRDKTNEGGLEFATYANLVRQKLVAAGFQEAANHELVNNLANFFNRVIVLINKYYGRKIPGVEKYAVTDSQRH